MVMKVKKEELVELSHRMIPSKENFKLNINVRDVTDVLPQVKHRPEIWYVLTDIEMNSHMGTHIEFPYHHWKEGITGADFPLEQLIGEAVVLDFSLKKKDEYISLNEVREYEGKIHEGDIIFIRTDMDKYFREDNWTDEVHLAEDALDWLLKFKPKVIGTDATGFEVPGTDYQPNHLKMFSNGIGMIESATNLKEIQRGRALVFILPLPIEGIDACPVRIIGIREGGIVYE
jgi:arylformamidase